MDFSFRGYDFAIDRRLGDFRFLAENQDCSKEILLEVCDHFRQLSEK
ncbi:MAG TPA: hypothetical protein VGB68_15500 [Pyrinomonadaceae bacterium]|jgi:hypothetical protein